MAVFHKCRYFHFAFFVFSASWFFVLHCFLHVYFTFQGVRNWEIMLFPILADMSCFRGHGLKRTMWAEPRSRFSRKTAVRVVDYLGQIALHFSIGTAQDGHCYFRYGWDDHRGSQCHNTSGSSVQDIEWSVSQTMLWTHHCMLTPWATWEFAHVTALALRQSSCPVLHAHSRWERALCEKSLLVF